MRLIIQIPCYNEAETLPTTLSALPRELPGVACVEWLVVDDGSSDGTAEVAESHNVDHVIRLKRNQGLAAAFSEGISACLSLGADIIVNTDADNQYDANDIPILIKPIVDGRADIVIGARPVKDIAHFSLLKKLLNRLGSSVVRGVSGTDVPDAPSGFRAFSRDAAKQINVFSRYTYTIETIIQAGLKNFSVESVPIRVNDDLRPSRLVKSIPSYVRQSLLTIIRIFVVYRPFRFFAVIGALMLTIGVLIGARFLYFYFSGEGGGHIQSLILGAVLIVIGVQTTLVAFLADLISVNRRLLEKLTYSSNEIREMVVRDISGKESPD